MKNNESFLRKLWKTLHSMKLGIILLILIGVLSTIGTIIPQENSLKYYETRYSPLKYELIKNLSLYKVYSSWWFILLISFLSLNLMLCSIRRFKVVMNLAKEGRKIDGELRKIEEWSNLYIEESKIKEIFNKMQFKKVMEKEYKEGKLYYSHKNSMGYLGSWITHLSLLIIIIFFSYGKINGFETFVHGVPGTILEVGDTDISLHIEDFDIIFREDFTVEQYISEVSVLKSGDIVDSGKVLVNHPFRTSNMNIYQNGTGWAVEANLYKDGVEYKNKTLYQGEFFIEDDQKIALQFVNFYPDLDSESEDLKTKTPFPNHPVMLYALFYDGHRVDMNLIHMGEEVGYGEYTFKIDNPQMFTLLQIVRDPGIAGAFVGGILLIIGIFLAFYINPKKLIIYVDKNQDFKIYGRSYKNHKLYQEQLKTTIDFLGGEEEWTF